MADDSLEPEHEASAQELMALVVPKTEEEEDDNVGRTNNDPTPAFMNDISSSIGDTVEAVFADAGGVGGGEDDDDEEETEEGPSDLNLEGPEPMPQGDAIQSQLGLLDLMVNSSIAAELQPQQMQLQQQPAAAAISSIPPNLLQQTGNAAAFAAALNSYLLAAAAAGGLNLTAAAPNMFMMQPQQQHQQPPQVQPTLPLQLANPAFPMAAPTGGNTSILENLGLNIVLLQQAQAGPTATPPPENPSTTATNVTNQAPVFFQFPVQQLPQQQMQPQLDPAAFLRAALLMQNNTMMMPGVPQQGNAGPAPNNVVASYQSSNSTDTDSNASSSNNNNATANPMGLPNNTASLFPMAALQQLVPLFGGALPMAASLQTVPIQQQQAQQTVPPPQPPPQPSLPNPSDANAGPGKSNSQRATIPLYLDHDDSCLTSYQCFLRKQIELFEAGDDELQGTAQGRNTPLHRGQIGIRCRHCAHLPKAARARGGVYYSRTIDGVCK